MLTFGELHPYFQRSFSTAVATNKRARLRSLREGTVVTDNFPDQPVDLRSYNWRDGLDARNWWWQLQQLPSLAWAVGDWTGAHDELRKTLSFNFDVIHNWQERHTTNSAKDSTLAWHDHAAALRALNLFRWANFVDSIAGDEYQSEIKWLVELVATHVEWLIKAENYTRHTNHGFEQAWILLQIGLAWPSHKGALDAKETGEARLIDEITFAFTDEGVHKENSPGYHWFMAKKLAEVGECVEATGLVLEELDLLALNKQIEQFTEAISLPGGALPLIGDTQVSGPQRAEMNQRRSALAYKVPVDEVSSFDYSKSGYFIRRQVQSPEGNSNHFTMKCVHLSDYHRHDDDLAIHLQHGGCVVLGDGGVYSYNEKDPLRRFLRSPYAHSTVFPKDTEVGIRKRKRLPKAPRLRWNNASQTVRGETYQYSDLVISRRVKFDSLSGDTFRIVDEVVNRRKASVDMITNFFVPVGLDELTQCELEEGSWIAQTGGVVLQIKFDSANLGLSRIVSGEGDCLADTAVYSPTLNVSMDASRLELGWKVEPNSKSQRVCYVSAVPAHES